MHFFFPIEGINVPCRSGSGSRNVDQFLDAFRGPQCGQFWQSAFVCFFWRLVITWGSVASRRKRMQ